MSELLTLYVSGVPMTKGSWRSITDRRTGKPRLIPDNPDEEAWALAISWAAKAKLRGRAPSKARIRIGCVFMMPPRAGRKSYNRDVDKLLRSVLDAMTKVVYVDDEQVDDVRAIKLRGDNPGVAITVEEIE